MKLTDKNNQSVELLPSQARNYNRNSDKAGYMIPYGGTPENPEFLYPEELTASGVKAFNSNEEYNRYLGDKGGQIVSSGINEFGQKFAPVIAASFIAPYAITSGIQMYSNPFVKAALDVVGSVDGIRNAFTDNGISKTIKLAKEGDTWGALKSGVGDVFDVTGGVGLLDDIYKYGRGASKRLAEAVVRIGDRASNSSALKEQLLHKNTINYVLNPFADPNLAYNLPYKYSGMAQNIDNAPAKPGDVVDQFFRKSFVKSSDTSTLPTELKSYLDKNYKGKSIGHIDFGEARSGDTYSNPRWYPLSDKTESYNIDDFTGGEFIKIKDDVKGSWVLTPDYKFVLDPGGHNTYIGRRGNNFVAENYDIWKFKPSEFMNRYGLKFNPKAWALKQGLKFIDRQGSPIVYKWTTTTPDYYKKVKTDIFPKIKPNVRDFDFSNIAKYFENKSGQAIGLEL